MSGPRARAGKAGMVKYSGGDERRIFGGYVEDLPSFLILLLILLAFVIAVLWIVLPFAVFGIKSRLDETNRLLAELRDAQKRPATPTGAEASVEELIARRRALAGEG